jgi:site-specific DNA recombinase
MTPIGRSAISDALTPQEDWMLVAHIPPIVSQEPFELVQAKLSHSQQFATRHHTAHDYGLRALVSCGRCRAACWARMGHPAYGYDICRGKMHPIHSGRDERCASRFIPAQSLDELVWRDLCEVLTHPEAIGQALHRAQGGHWLPHELQARREQLRKGRVSLDQQLERLTAAYLGGVMPWGEYQRRRHELEQRLQALDSQAQQLEASVDRHVELAALVTAIEDFCQRVRHGLAHTTFAQKRHLVELLIDRVVVTNEEVEIRYVIPTTPHSEHVRFCHLRKDYFHHHAPVV